MSFFTKKYKWSILLAILVFCFSLNSLNMKADNAVSAQPDQMTATLSEIEGNVSVIKAQDQKQVGAEEDMDLAPGDRVVTKENSTAQISFDDETTVEVGENSDLTVKGLNVNLTTGRRQISLGLVLGKLFSIVKKAVEGGHELSVETPCGMASVKGTEFGVDLDKDSSHIGVYDGLVAVSGVDKDGKLTEPVLVNPNQETSVSKGTRPAAVRTFSGRWLAYKTRITALRNYTVKLRVLKKNGEIKKFRELRQLYRLQHKGRLTPQQKQRLQELKGKHPHIWKEINAKHKRRKRLEQR